MAVVALAAFRTQLTVFISPPIPPAISVKLIQKLLLFTWYISYLNTTYELTRRRTDRQRERGQIRARSRHTHTYFWGKIAIISSILFSLINDELIVFKYKK